METSIATVPVDAVKATVSIFVTPSNSVVRPAAVIVSVSSPAPPSILSVLVSAPAMAIVSLPLPPLTSMSLVSEATTDNLPVKVDASIVASMVVSPLVPATKSTAAVIVKSLSPETVTVFNALEATAANVDLTVPDVMASVSIPSAVNVPADRLDTANFCVSAVPATAAAPYVKVRSAAPLRISASTMPFKPVNAVSPVALDADRPTVVKSLIRSVATVVTAAALVWKLDRNSFSKPVV